MLRGVEDAPLTFFNFITLENDNQDVRLTAAYSSILIQYTGYIDQVLDLVVHFQDTFQRNLAECTWFTACTPWCVDTSRNFGI